MIEKLCIFCKHFAWTAEEMYGRGSTLTGPMFDGGWAECAKAHFDGLKAPKDEAEYRDVIMQGENCADYFAVHFRT